MSSLLPAHELLGPPAPDAELPSKVSGMWIVDKVSSKRAGPSQLALVPK